MIKQRIKMGHAALAMEHKWPNDDPPLGYELGEDRRLEIHESEAELVREIFERYLEVKSMRVVAKELNERGVTTKGGEWSARRVGNVLENSLYIGEFNVGPVSDHILEYETLKQEVFEGARVIRGRFKHAPESTRGKASKEARRRKVNDAVDLYTEHL